MARPLKGNEASQGTDEPLIVGDFDVSGLAVDPHTGKVDGPVVSLGGTPLKYLDFPLAAQLCQCCGTELLRSGSRWSGWFCNDCGRNVDTLNTSVGQIVFPVGRHSIMNQVGLRGYVPIDPVNVERFVTSMKGLFGSMDRLAAWGDEIVRRNCDATGIGAGLSAVDTIPIRKYLKAVAGLSRRAAFDAMCDWWTSPETTG